MKFRHLLPAVVAAGALMISGVASAALIWQWTGSVNDWATATQATPNGPITDGPPPPSTGTVTPNPATSGDGDTTFTLNTNTFDPATTITLQEFQNAADYYSVGLDFSSTTAGTASSGMLGYTVTTTDPTGLSQAFLDSIIGPVGGGNVTKDIYASLAAYQAGDAPLLSLNSIDGSSVNGAFGSRQSFYVVDTVNSGDIHDIHNHFIPDPGTLSLLGIGMVGLGARRRMIKKAKA